MRPLILVLSLVLGLVPLVGVAWIFVQRNDHPLTIFVTMDGLFMSLILLTLSGLFPAERVLGNARPGHDRQEKEAAPAKAPAAKAS